MKYRFVHIVIFIGLLMACNSERSSGVKNVRICTQYDGTVCQNHQTRIDAAERKLFLTARLQEVDKGSEVRIVWVFMNGQYPYEIHSENINCNQSDQVIHSELRKPVDGWPKGQYKVLVQLNSDTSHTETREFTIY